MAHEFYTLDVFTTEVFTGNPLAVVMNAGDLDGGAIKTLKKQ